MEQSMNQEIPQVVVIGVGNEYRGDDGVGIIVARRLAKLNLPGVSVIESRSDATELMRIWSGAGAVVLIDAIRAGIDPGTVMKFDLSRDEIPARYFSHTTHSFGVMEAVRLARSLGELPVNLKLFGIEGEKFDARVGLTPLVDKVSREIVDKIALECDKLLSSAIHRG